MCIGLLHRPKANWHGKFKPSSLQDKVAISKMTIFFHVSASYYLNSLWLEVGLESSGELRAKIARGHSDNIELQMISFQQL